MHRHRLLARVLCAASLVALLVVCPLRTSAQPSSCCSGQYGCPNGGGESGGVTYCCPSGGSINFGSQCSCGAPQSCPTAPSYGKIAVWNQLNCPADATLRTVTFPSSGSFSSCLDVTDTLPAFGNLQVYCTGTGNTWTVSQYSNAATCSSGSTADFSTKQPYGLDSSCYNFKGGSFVLYCPSQTAPTGSTVSWPLMHTAMGQYHTPPVSTTANQPSIAFWPQSSSCSSGTATMGVVTNGNCFNRASWRSTTNDNSYKLTCASHSESSSWTLQYWYSGSGCPSTTTPTTVTGTGMGCTALDASTTMIVDCASLAGGRSFNYLPMIDGGWSTWSQCDVSCGGGPGTQSRTCTSPTPSSGGAACVGESQQACNTPSCGSSATSTGSASSTGGSSAASTGGNSVASTGSPSGQSAYDPTVWLGTYTIASGCDQTQCCCALTSTITASGDSYIVTGTNLAGKCGTSVPASVQAAAPTPTSDTATYTVNGQAHTAQRQSDGSIIDTNTAAASCSATLTKSSAVNGAGAQSAPFQPFHLFAVLLVSAVAALVAF